MKIINFIVLGVIFICVIALVINYSFHNHKNSTQQIKLEEKFSIGVLEGDTTQMFSTPWDVTVDKDGNIYVLDMQDGRIKKFDREGRFVLSIGAKGRGPGEMILPWRIILDKTGEIVLFDRGNLRISRFTNNGRFINSFYLSFNFEDAVLDSEDNIYLHDYHTPKIIHKLDSEGNYLFSFMKAVQPKIQRVKPHLNAGRIALASNGKIVLALPYPYTLYFFSKNGDLLKKIRIQASYAKPPYILTGGLITLFTIMDVSIWNDYIFILNRCIKIIKKADQYEKLKYTESSYIDIFSPNDVLLKHHGIGNSEAVAACFDKSGNYYIVVQEPFPQVRVFKVLFNKIGL